MKARVAGRHDHWLPLPNGKHITPRVKHCMTAYQNLWGERPLPHGEARDMAWAMLNFHLPRLTRPESAEYYAFVRRLMAHQKRVKNQTSAQNVRKKSQKK